MGNPPPGHDGGPVFNRRQCRQHGRDPALGGHGGQPCGSGGIRTPACHFAGRFQQAGGHAGRGPGTHPPHCAPERQAA